MTRIEHPRGEGATNNQRKFTLEDTFGTAHELTDVEAALKYFGDEVKRWEEALPKSLPIREHIIQQPKSISAALYNFLRFRRDVVDTNEFSSHLEHSARDGDYREAYQNLRVTARHWIPFKSSGGIALLELCKAERNAAAEAFCKELYDRTQILYTHDDGTAEAQRITGQEAAKLELARAWTGSTYEDSLHTLQHLNESGKSVFQSIASIYTDAKELSDSQANEFRSEFSKELKRLQSLISSFKANTSKAMEETKSSIEKYRDGYANDVDSKIEEIERTVFEKTVLKQPTEFWRKRAKRLRNQGLGWSAALVATLGGSAYGFLHYVSVLAQHPNVAPSGIHLFQSITGFIVAVGVVGYAMRVLGKLTLSAFHLQRDAEERAELTQFYLGLGIETEMSEESRNLALRALFSRSESGLLGTDSGGDLGALIDALKSQRSN